jgi:energy-coupling factor transport system ATP-binding protein
MIEISDINYGYDEEIIFKDFNFSIKKGEFLMVFGKNGSGKSTLAKLITGITIPTKGKILIDRLDTSTDDIWEIRKFLGVIFQNPEDQFVGTTVLEEMTFILENYDETNIEEKIEDALKKVDLIDKKNEHIDDLSGGQKQKLALASALLLKPKLLVLDEASSMLDPRSRKELLILLKKLNESKVTIIYITHYLEEITYASRCLLLDEGKIIKDEIPSRFLEGDLLKYNLIIPFHLKLLMKLNKDNKNNKNFKLENSQSVVDEICQYL